MPLKFRNSLTSGSFMIPVKVLWADHYFYSQRDIKKNQSIRLVYISWKYFIVSNISVVFSPFISIILAEKHLEF